MEKLQRFGCILRAAFCGYHIYIYIYIYTYIYIHIFGFRRHMVPGPGPFLSVEASLVRETHLLAGLSTAGNLPCVVQHATKHTQHLTRLAHSSLKLACAVPGLFRREYAMLDKLNMRSVNVLEPNGRFEGAGFVSSFPMPCCWSHGCQSTRLALELPIDLNFVVSLERCSTPYPHSSRNREHTQKLLILSEPRRLRYPLLLGVHAPGDGPEETCKIKCDKEQSKHNSGKRL